MAFRGDRVSDHSDLAKQLDSYRQLRAREDHAAATDLLAGIYEELSAVVRPTIRSRLSNKGDIDDVIQEIFVAVLKHSLSAEFTEERQFRLLMGIARQQIAEHLRRGSLGLSSSRIAQAPEIGGVGEGTVAHQRPSSMTSPGSPPEAASREAAIEQTEAELREVNERLSGQLRQQHPELFDADGRLIESEYRRQVAERGDGRLTRGEILQKDSEQQRPAGGARSADGS
jgi:DNA-directed RNA polymerase specialized sigma24 family protein